MAALQNNFFITNLMEVLQRDPECSRPEACSVLESVSAAAAGKPLSCPNHEGKVSLLPSDVETKFGNIWWEYEGKTIKRVVGKIAARM